MARPEKTTPEATIKALRKCDGIKSKAAEMLNVSRWTVDNMCERYPEVQRVYLEERETLLDVSESQLATILKADLVGGEIDQQVIERMVRFHLSTVGKHRGYGDSDYDLERAKKALGSVTDLDLSQLSDDQLRTFKKLLIIANKPQGETVTPPPRYKSTDMTAKEAVAEIRSMENLSDVIKFVPKAEDRVTVTRAARQRRNAIKKENETND